jgi:hypothetical protein
LKKDDKEMSIYLSYQTVMDHKFDINFDKRKNELLIKRFENEITYLENNQDTVILSISGKNNGDNVKERIEKLKEILKETKKIKTDKIQGIFDEVDKHIYKKSWNKLLAYHKIIKVKEYIKNTYGEGDFQTQIIEELTKLIDEKKINTKKCVEYDKDKEKIIKIPILVVDIEKKEYNINYNAK